MDKKQALKILIENSELLKEETKKLILGKLDSYSEEEIDSMGRVFASELKANLEDNEELLREAGIIPEE